MLAVLGGLADVERDMIRTRTAEGRSRAKAQGKHMGRPPSLAPAQQKEAIRRARRTLRWKNSPQLPCEPRHDFPAGNLMLGTPD
jgi:DNA invertase Pin-like site-specific DNA recombinase